MLVCSAPAGSGSVVPVLGAAPLAVVASGGSTGQSPPSGVGAGVVGAVGVAAASSSALPVVGFSVMVLLVGMSDLE